MYNYKVDCIFDTRGSLQQRSSSNIYLLHYSSRKLRKLQTIHLYLLPLLSRTNMSSSSHNQHQQTAPGSRPTGATGGGYYRHRCRNWEQPDHPRDYTFNDRADVLCAHCLVSSSLFQAPASTNYRISAHPAAAEGSMLYAAQISRGA